MKTYCVRCKKNTEYLNSKMLKQKMMDSLCNQNVLPMELKSQDL